MRYPEGWFRLTSAEELPPGSVRTLRAFGRELLLYRTASGRAAVAEPHCPHAGAHLGHGGRVEGECLRCPFHGLGYDAAGRCREDARDRSALSVWPSEIWQGQLMVYFSDERRAPEWQLPSLPRQDWLPPRWRSLRLTGHVDDVAENGVDFRHFVTVHHYSNLRQPQIDIDGRKLHSRFGFDRQNPVSARLGVVSAVFDTDMWGLGCSITDLRVGPLHFRLLLLATQLEEKQLEFSIGISLERPSLMRGRGRTIFDGAAAGLLRYMHHTIVGDVLQDREIWAHRRRLERPALSAEDGAVVAFRRYAEQFYKESP